ALQGCCERPRLREIVLTQRTEPVFTDWDNVGGVYSGVQLLKCGACGLYVVVIDGSEASREIVDGEITDGGDATAVHDLHSLWSGRAAGLDQRCGADVRRAQAIF